MREVDIFLTRKGELRLMMPSWEDEVSTDKPVYQMQSILGYVIAEGDTRREVYEGTARMLGLNRAEEIAAGMIRGDGIFFVTNRKDALLENGGCAA